MSSYPGDAPYLSIGTFRKNGERVAVPVWFASLNERLYVFTEFKAYKVKRLGRDPRVEVAECDIRGKVRGPWRAGTGRVMDPNSEAAVIKDVYAALARKYGWQMWIADTASRLTGRIKNRAMLELNISAAC